GLARAHRGRGAVRPGGRAGGWPAGPPGPAAGHATGSEERQQPVPGERPEATLREGGGGVTPAPTAIRTVRWMVRDTFRQSLYTKLFWVMLGLTGLCTLFCLGIEVDAPPERERHPDELPFRHPKSDVQADAARAEGIIIPEGKIRLGFGLFAFDIAKNKADSV